MIGVSDFYTGAFPAEYGNALSGVFDIRMRNGNNQETEFTLQAGLLGLDLSAEGPFKKGYGGSYLFNYRYSAFSLMDNLNCPPKKQAPFHSGPSEGSSMKYIPSGPKIISE